MTPQAGTAPQPREATSVKGSAVSHIIMKREVCLQPPQVSGNVSGIGGD